MCIFIGDYTCKADSKCRVVVPASFRRSATAAGQTVFVLRCNIFERCIDMYPLDEWERMLSAVRAGMNPFNASHVVFLREFCRGTLEVEMDANGRVLLSRRMLEEVGIDKDMVFAGQDHMIQIWDAKAYEEAAVSPAELGKLAEEIFKEK